MPTSCRLPRSVLRFLALPALALACTDGLNPDFDPTEISIEVSGAGGGQGRVTGPTATKIDCVIGWPSPGNAIGPTCQSTFTDAGAGGVFTLDAVPDANSTHVDWSGDCTGSTCQLSFPQGKDTTFRVTARLWLRPPTVTIDEPADNAIFPSTTPGGADVPFTATARDARGSLLSQDRLTWTSSRDGVLCPAPGMTIPLCSVLPSFDLSPGQHLVVLTGRDDDGTASSDTVRLTVGAPANFAPRAEIITPQEGATLPSDQPIRFAGIGTDPEDGVLPDSALSWSDVGLGSVFTGSNVDRLLAPGNHRVILTVRDSQGATATDDVRFTVVEVTSGPGSISGRVTGNGFGVGGATVILSGAASATTTSDGTGSYAFADLAPGTYTVRVVVELNIGFPANPQTVVLGAGENRIINFAGTY